METKVSTANGSVTIDRPNKERPQAEIMDMRSFFRDSEKVVRSFLAYWDNKAKANQALYPYKMTADAWWRAFIEWAYKSAAR